jgi:hypothetical protein
MSSSGWTALVRCGGLVGLLSVAPSVAMASTISLLANPLILTHGAQGTITFTLTNGSLDTIEFDNGFKIEFSPVFGDFPNTHFTETETPGTCTAGELLGPNASCVLLTIGITTDNVLAGSTDACQCEHYLALWGANYFDPPVPANTIPGPPSFVTGSTDFLFQDVAAPVPSAVPEPATAALLLAGLTGSGVRRLFRGRLGRFGARRR